MENKINIAKLLKDCPAGMELDCTMFDNVTFIDVEGDDKPICIRTGDIYRYLTKFGTWTFDENAKCVIYPKGKTTWVGFHRPFKDGDIVAYDNLYGNAEIFIFKDKKENNTLSYCYLMLDGDELVIEEGAYYVTRLATEEEKTKLFNAIKANGYKWNAETNTLEELVESNEDVDDRVVMSGIYFDRENYADEVELHLGNYEIEIRDGKTYAVFKNQETKTLEKLPKFKVGDRITKRGSIENWIVSSVSSEYYGLKLPKGIEGIGVLPVVEQDDWELVPNKFDITTLVPFESKVLMRSSNAREWVGTIYSHYNNNYFFGCGMMCQQCIPYEGNEHLIGKTDDCNDFYKTW